VSNRFAARLGWALWAISLALLFGYLALYLAHVLQIVQPSVLDWIEDVFGALFLIAFATLGAIIVWRHPGNAVGWIFCAIGLLWVVERFAAMYAIDTLVAEPGARPYGMAGAWVQNWTWAAFSGLLYVFLPLLFPNGRLLSARWRPVAWLGAASVVLMVLGEAFHSGKLANSTLLEKFDNPLGFDPLGGDLLGPVGGVFGLVAVVGFILALVSMLAAATALILRLRRAAGEERQQLKWFAYFGSILAVLFVLQGTVRYLLNVSTPEFEVVYRSANAIVQTCLPVAIGLAMLRYRLYAIDILINRTLVYGALTVTLSVVYYGSVVLLQGLVRAVTGQQSDLAIVGSTLVIAVLFQPSRRSIQDVIDRRFYRRTYHAAQVLAAFGATARDGVDLDELRSRLLAVTDQAMQPTQVTLWLRDDAESARTTPATEAAPRVV